MRAGVRGVLLRYGMTVGGGVVFGGLAAGGLNGKQAQLPVRDRAFAFGCPGKVVQQGLKAQVPVSACLSPSPNRGDNHLPQA